MKWKIYKVTNTINDKKYIGITVQKLKARLNGHSQAGEGRRSKAPSCLGLAIKKYGKENFLIEAIDFADSEEEALAKETFYINQHKSLAKNGCGYNIVENSVTNKWSDESIAKSTNTRIQNKKVKTNLSTQETEFIGVHFLIERKRWAWSFNVNGKRVGSKNFSTDFDAALDRDISLPEYFTEKICLMTMNFPEKYQDIIDGEIGRPVKELKIESKKSNYHFVAYEKRKGTWRARVTNKGKTVAAIASFSEQKEAAEVADYLNLKYLDDEAFLNFPERKQEYLSDNYKIPPTNLHKSSALPYENLSLDKNNGKIKYRIHLQHKGVKHRDIFSTLESAVKRRDELRAQYGLQPAIDFPELL